MITRFGLECMLYARRRFEQDEGVITIVSILTFSQPRPKSSFVSVAFYSVTDYIVPVSDVFSLTMPAVVSVRNLTRNRRRKEVETTT
jgi:hypothetical protein